MKRAALVLCLLLATRAAAAHGLRTAYVQLSEVTPGHASVQLSTSVPEPSLQVWVERCETSLSSSEAPRALTRSLRLDCAGPLAGRRLGVNGRGPVVSEAVLDVYLRSGAHATRLLTTDAPVWELPLGSSRGAVARQYLELGIRHILSGPDHLLFLFLLALLLKRPGAVLLAETAFTLSHSLSFTANALGWIQVSSTAAEACIALSLLLLAVDVERPRATTVSALRGAGLALGFGLVHGLGFAAGVREIGLPVHAVGTALLAFGGGVELGQVAFLTVVLGAISTLQRLRPWPQAVRACTYCAGGLSTFWLLGRLWLCFVV
jgi:hypothetical protein